jgi:hypothetical protein
MEFSRNRSARWRFLLSLNPKLETRAACLCTKKTPRGQGVSAAGETLLIAGWVADLLPLDAQALHSVFLVSDDLSGER